MKQSFFRETLHISDFFIIFASANKGNLEPTPCGHNTGYQSYVYEFQFYVCSRMRLC